MTNIYYTINDILLLEKEFNKENNYKLPDKTIQYIQNILARVNDPTYNRTPYFPNNKKNKKKYNGAKQDEFQPISNFKKTEIIKKDGIEKEINDIRLLINKLSQQTYDKIVIILISKLNEININETYNIDSINKIGYTIFNMATTNKFNSNIYARLCSKLITEFEFMNSIIYDNITEFMKQFNNMVFVNPEEDYDEFCKMNISNEKRRSMSLFIINLYKNNVITIDIVIQYIINIQNIITNNIDDSSKKMENQELTENLYILLTNIPFLIIKKQKEWIKIYENIKFIKNLTSNSKLGISSKCKFKHMDIYDQLK
jgi:hypothetical protein